MIKLQCLAKVQRITVRLQKVQQHESEENEIRHTEI